MPIVAFTQKETGEKYQLDLPTNYTSSDFGNAYRAEQAKRKELAQQESTVTEPATQEPVTTQEGTTTEPTLRQIGEGLVGEIAIASAGQVAGAATGIGYIPIAFASGWAGSAFAQEREGREDFSYGRAWMGGLINLIPFSNAAKTAKAAAAMKGLTLTKSQLTKAVATAETKRGAVIGATEGAGISLIDTGEVDVSDVFMMAVGGGTLGNVIGRTGVGIKNVFSESKAKRVFEKLKDKTPDEIDLMVANKEITAVDIANASPSWGEEGLRGAKKVSEEVALGVETKNAVELLKAKEFLQGRPGEQGDFGRRFLDFKNKFARNMTLGKDTANAVFYGKNINTARLDVSSKIAVTLEKAIKKNPDLEQHLNDYLADPRRIMPDRIKEFPVVEASIRKFNSELEIMQTELAGQLNVYKLVGMSDVQRRATAKQILNNEVYLTQEYELYTNPDFIVNPIKQQKATDAIAKSIEQKLFKEKLKKGITNPNIKKIKEQAKIEADVQIQKILQPSAKNLQTEEGLRSANAGILKSKKDLSPEVIDMLQPITSPVEKIRGTLNRVSSLVSNNTSDIKVMESLLRSGMAKRVKDIPNNVRNEYTELNLKRDLNNEKLKAERIFVPKEIQEALDATYINNQQVQVTGFIKPIYEAWNTLVGTSKAVLVIFNPPSYAVNALGAGSTMIGMGMNPLSRESYQGFKLALGEYEGIRRIASGSTVESNEAYLNLVQDMKKYGLASGNVDIGDLRNSVEQGLFPKGAVNKIISPFSKAYQATDIAARFSVWKHNQKRLEKMLPNLKGDDLKLAAAKLTNDTFPNYDKVPEVVRFASRVGGLTPFIAFTSELTRNIYFQAKYAAQMMKGTFGKDIGIDLTNANVGAMRREGLLRAGSLIALTGSAAGGIDYYNSEQGMTPEMESAYDDVLARDYEKGKQKAHFNIDLKNKTASSMNPSYIVPHQIITEAISVGFSERPMNDLGAFLSNNLFGKGNFPSIAIAQAVQNKEEGRLIATDEDWYKNAVTSFGYVFKKILTTGAQRELEAAKDIYDKGKDARYTTKELALRQVGVRVQKDDWNQRAIGSVKQVVERLRANTKPYADEVKQNPNMSQQERQDLYNQANEKRKKSFEVLFRNKKSLEKLGFNDTEINEVFLKSGINRKDRYGLKKDIYYDMNFEITKDTSEIYDERSKDKTYSEFMIELRPLRKTDPVLYNKLRNKANEERRDSRKDLTLEEELLKGLSVKDRAEIVFKANSKERIRLRKIGVITADVRKEMRARGYK
tara:strand:- start:5 stop:3802 length:3798 start_codon:yes stop_codon:yes gene_type:complete